MLKCLIVLGLVITITVISAGQDEGVKKDCEDYESLERVAMCYTHNPLSKLRTVVEKLERAVIVDEYFLFGRQIRVNSCACVEE